MRTKSPTRRLIPPKSVEIHIRRRANPDSPPYWERFELPYRPNLNIISCLMEIKNPVTKEATKTTPPVWQMNCLEQVCGICTMVINGRARQSCSALIDNLEQPIKLEPRQGINIITTGATLNVVQGNYIGIDASGTAALGNGGNGVAMNLGASGNQIGGTAPGAGNVVSGNVASGIVCRGAGTSNNTLQGNFCGTNASGTAAIPNQNDGIRFDSGGSDNIVGGTAPGARNIISGNLGHGVHIDDFPVEDGGPHLGTARNTVQGNFIGTNVTGINPLGNRLPGVIIFGGASDNLIGGTAPGAGNVIAFTTGGTIDDGQGGFITIVGAGVSVANDSVIAGDSGGGTSLRNRISNNSIFANNGLGIDLSSLANGAATQGPTANDSCDADAGPNNFQNLPRLTSVSSSGGNTTIQGTLDSAPNTTFTIEFFSNDSCDASGFGEGRTFIGSTTVTTDANCNAGFSFASTTVPAGQQFITATATDPNGNTSEFSACGFVNADLSIDKTASPNPVVTGSDVTYSLTVNYNGPAPAANVTVTDNLPSQTTFKSLTSPSGWTCVTPSVGSNGTVTCAKPTMASSESLATFTIVATVDCSVADGIVISDSATVSSSTTDSNPSNNSSTAMVTASNPPPTITCPPDQNVPNDPGQCSATVDPGTATATDNCPGVTATGSRSDGKPVTDHSYPVGLTIITWTASDSAGNSSSCRQTITVRDTERPQITCPANISVNSDPGVCGAKVTYTAPVGTDNCTGATTTQTAGLASGSTFPVGTTTNTFEVTDASGSKSSCSFTVTVKDTEPPKITCPANITVDNDPSTCGANVTYTAPVGTDNCISATTTQTAGLPSGSTFPVGTTTNTFEVTDASGSKSSCSFTVTVKDTEPPKITCPANITVTTNLGSNTAVVSYPAPTATDNCGIPVVSCSLPSGSSFPLGTTTVNCTATDNAGNAGTCAFAVTVLSPQAATQQISRTVNTLVSQGVLSQGNGNALNAKLQAAINSLNSGNVTAACNELQAFINQTQAFINSGKLTPAQGQALIDSANAVRTVLGC